MAKVLGVQNGLKVHGWFSCVACSLQGLHILLTYLNDTLIQRSSFLAQGLSQRVSIILRRLYLNLMLLLCVVRLFHVASASYTLKYHVELTNIILQVQT